MADVKIQVLTYYGDTWEKVYRGPREGIPEQYREDVALIDASDSMIVPGIGFWYETHDFLEVYALSRLVQGSDESWRVERPSDYDPEKKE
jgi:hypothetical protein